MFPLISPSFISKAMQGGRDIGGKRINGKYNSANRAGILSQFYNKSLGNSHSRIFTILLL